MFKQRGFSLLELILVVTIISVLFVIAVDRLVILKVEAEKTAMQQVLGTLRSAMNIQVAKHIARNNLANLSAAEGQNPMEWLSTKPERYIGIKDEPDPSDIEGYRWYFDSYNRWLVYRVGNSDYFKSSLKGPKRARFQVILDYTDSNNNGIYDTNTEEISGLRLQNLEPYEWLNEPITIDDYVKP